MSSYDKRLEEELAKLEKKKKNGTLDLTSGINSYLPSYTSPTRSIVTELPLYTAPRQDITAKHSLLDDIAPIRASGRWSKKDEDEDEDDSLLDFFQKGAFEDGFDWSDIPSAILGTAGDVGLNVVKGIAGLGEGIGDTISYGIAGAADALGKDEAADRWRKGAKTNVIDNLLKPAEDYLDQYSVLGRTADAVAQGIGQAATVIATGGIAGAVGLGVAGTTAVTTGLMGLSGVGSGMSEAYQMGANDLQALKIGLNSGAADAVSALIFGGLGKSINALGISKGLTSLDDIFAKALSSKVKNQIAKNVIEFGIKSGAEGLEEVIAGVAQAYGKYDNLLKDQGMTFGEVLQDENLLEQFLVGTLTSGVTQSGSIPGMYQGSLIEANREGKDFITGQTQNEQAVIKREVEKRIAEAEKKGEKLTAREKSKIEEQVTAALEKGYISIDTIEEVLGGDSRAEYESLKKESDEFDSLYDTTYEKLSEKQRDRLAELKAKNEKTSYKDALKASRQKMYDSVYELARGDRLVESYNEEARKKQDFVADYEKFKGTKHEEAARKTLDNAVKAGANNTNRVRDFVEMTAKLSADTGEVFEFKSGDQIKADFIERQTKEIAKIESIPEAQRTAEQSKMLAEMKTILENVQSGKTIVNGDITSKGIVINLDSAKALNKTVGHEITHSFESAKSYDKLRDALFSYAKAKGIDIDSKLSELNAKYAGVTDANPEAELVADLVGDFLFTDYDFISTLSANHRNVFQKMYDGVKYLLKIATAGSKEARELERVKKQFDKVYRDMTAQKNINENGNPQHSLERVGDIEYVRAEKNTFMKEDGSIASEREIFDSLVGKTISLPDGDVKIVKRLPGKDMYNELSRRYPKHLSQIDDPKQLNKSVNHNMEELLANSGATIIGEPDVDGRHEKQGISSFDTRTVKFYDGEKAYDIEFSIATLSNGEKIAYAKRFFGYDAELTKKIQAAEARSEQSPLNQRSAYGDIVSKDSEKSSGNTAKNSDISYSLSDSNGNQLTQEQAEYFKDSKVRDESGNLKVMYHGTSKGGFNVFDTYGSNYGLFGTGSYFTDSKTIGESYTKKGKGKNPQVYEAYLNIKNPMDMDAAADPAQWAKAFPDADFPESGTNEQFYRAVEEFYADQWMSKWEVAEEIQAGIESSMGYDGITHIGGGRVNPNGERHQVYIAFQPEQIKNIDNTKPTDNPDIRYSLSEDSDGNKLTKEQAEYFKKSKMRDDNGNLKPMYHGSKDGGFHVFDSGYSDDGRSFFFVDSNDVASSYSGTSETYAARSFRTAEDFNRFFAEIGTEEYEVREKDGKFQLYEDGDLAAVSDTAEGIYEEFRDWSGLGYGDVNYKVYLNLENPLEVDARGREWNELKNWSKAAYIKESGVEVKRVGEEFKLFDKKTGAEIPRAEIVVNQYNENMNPDNLRSIMVDKVNYILAMNTENLTTTRDVSKWAKKNGYDGVIFKNILDVGGYGGKYDPHTVAIAFDSNQIKSVANDKPTGDPDIRHSLSFMDEVQEEYGTYNVYGKDVKVQKPVDEIAPVAENSTVQTTTQLSEEKSISEMFPNEPTPQIELDALNQEKETLESRMLDMANSGDFSELESINERWMAVQARIEQLDSEISASESERINSLDDADAPMEMDAPYYGEPGKPESAPDPFMGRDMDEVAKSRKTKAYQYENPEVKPFFMDAAYGMLGDLNETVRGEKIFNGDVYYESGGEKGWMGTKRQTTADIAWLKDTYGYTYDQIRDGVNAIIEDDGKENNAVSKRIEFLLHDRLVNGYTGVWGEPMPPNQEYINFLKERDVNEYSREAFDSFMATADQYAPMEDIAPVATPATPNVEDIAPTKEEYVAVTPKRKKEPKMVRAGKPFDQKTANVLVNEPKVEKKKNGLWSMIKENVLDNGMVFEDLALKTKNRDLQAKWNFIRYAQSMAQRMVGNGTENVKSLDSIRQEVEKSGKTQEFYEYLYHWLNVDRMTLENRYDDTKNKAVFGDSVTADMSRAVAVQLGKKNPEFRRWAQDVYRYNSHLRTMMVNNGVISQETADLWQAMYPHYVPIRRVGDQGLNINVPLDTGRTGVNAPIKKATGGNSDILPLFDTMAQRTLQTYKAIAKNSFGVELKNTLGTTIAKEQTDVDGVIDSVDNHEGLLQEGKNGKKPTFTVFENGEKVTFEITDEMYNAMKPASDLMSYTNPVANRVSNFHRGLLTEYNPVFMATNAIKDTQDILINSQHPVKTYANLPRATWEIAKNGKWFREYMENGGEDNTYFDGENNSFDTEEKGARKLLGIPPLSWISKANNFIERTPRLAEYIASRESGRSIEVSMLDAARVTTNFAAGGKLTKLLNRNGATFLNASMQGVVQQARNFREAKMNGLKGWAQLAGKFALAGLPAMLLNGLMWDDDDEYEELSDYVKQNYYIVGKYGDGKFVRIPKGRTLAIIQNAFEQMENAITGDDEVDLKSFLELVVSNLAPNNPVEDNILAPIIQAAKNETWYGEDLVPTRLQDLPAAEQFDESTDAISKWLGEKLNLSPYKINYLLDQYSGGVGDTILPMLTPEAESGDNTLLGNMLAPWKSKFATDSVMNNQNVADFYDVKDELTTNAKSSKATDEDVLMSKYMNAVNAELSDLYAQKREIQNSGLSAAEKYAQVRNIQSQIVSLTKEGLATYKDIVYEGEYARIGDRLYTKNDEGEWQKLSDEQVTKYEVTKAAGDAPYATDGTNHYRWYEPGEDAGEDAKPGWRKVTEKELERQNEVTSGLGITPEEYWGNKDEYSFAYDNPESYAVAKAVGGYKAYKQYSADLNDIKADKDKYGKTINGSKKEKVIEYINSLDADYYTKLILYKSEYTSYDDENYEIIEYLNGRKDISFEEEIDILRKLGFSVTAEGNISW